MASSKVGVQPAIQKATKLSTKIRKSPLLKSALEVACKTIHVKFLTPSMPVKTRWNSIYLMIEALFPMKVALSFMIAEASREEKKKWEKLMLAETDWEQLEAWRSVLKTPFLMTKAFETDTTPSAHLVIPKMYDFVVELKNHGESKNKSISKFSKILEDEVTKRFPHFGCHDEVFAMAHYLDPVFKGVALQEVFMIEGTKIEIKERNAKYEEVGLELEDGGVDEELEEAGVQLEEGGVDEEPEEAGVQLEVPEMSAIQKLAAERNKTVKPKSDIEEEIEAYENTHIDGKPEITEWWRLNSNKFPKLARIAREILACPASSASSERVFSVTGLVCSNKRKWLSNSHIEDLAIINLNHKKLQDIRGRFEVDLTKKTEKELKSCEVEMQINREEDEVDNFFKTVGCQKVAVREVDSDSELESESDIEDFDEEDGESD